MSPTSPAPGNALAKQTLFHNHNPSAQPEPDSERHPMKLRIHLEYVHPWPNHIGLFVARAKGWYAEHGWDVDIISDGHDRGNPSDLVAAGEYQVASVRLGELIEYRHTEVPLVGVATFNQCQLPGVFGRKSDGIHRWRDLEGKHVSIPPSPRLTHMVREAVEADGGDFDLLNVTHPEFWEPDMRAIEKGTFDAVFNVLGWEPYQGCTPVEDITFLDFDQVGVAPHHAYFVCFTQEMCEAQPQVVRDFLDATARGYRFAAENPDEAIALAGSPMCNMDPEVLRLSLEHMRPTWFAPSGRWGEIQPELVRSYTQWMIDGGFTTASLEDIEGAVTNDFLP